MRETAPFKISFFQSNFSLSKRLHYLTFLAQVYAESSPPFSRHQIPHQFPFCLQTFILTLDSPAAMLQQPRVPATGQRQAIEIHIKWREVLAQKRIMLKILSRHTGHSMRKLDAVGFHLET